MNSSLNAQYLPSYRFDKKSYMRFRLVVISVTLNDIERPNGPYFALFHLILVRYHHKTIVRLTSVSKSTFDSLWPLLIPSAQLFSDYLSKTNSDNSV